MRSMHLMRPHRCDDAHLVRAGERGAYWQSRDGMVVHLAAREERHYRARERGMHEACAPEGGVVHAPARIARRRARDDAGRIGAVGVAMALWMRLFAGSA